MNKYGKTPAEVIGEFHPLFRSLIWVAAARSDDEARPILNYILVQRAGLEYKIVATDGKRIHVATFDPGMFDEDIEPIEIGLYEVIAKSPKFIVISADDSLDHNKYPDWRKVVPPLNLKHSDTIESRTIAKLGIATGQLLATDFAIEAVGFGHGFKKDSTVSIEFAASQDGGAFVIKHELGTAAVMPMRLVHDAESPPKDDAEATPEIPGLSEPLQELAATLQAGESMEISVDGTKIVEIKSTKQKK